MPFPDDEEYDLVKEFEAEIQSSYKVVQPLLEGRTVRWPSGHHQGSTPWAPTVERVPLIQELHMFAVIKFVGEKRTAISIHNSELAAKRRAFKRATRRASKLDSTVDEVYDGYMVDEVIFRVCPVEITENCHA